MEQVVEFQAKNKGVESTWHMNKTHWIKVVYDLDIPTAEIEILVKQVFDTIVSSMTKSKKKELELS